MEIHLRQNYGVDMIIVIVQEANDKDFVTFSGDSGIYLTLNARTWDRVQSSNEESYDTEI